MAPRVSVLTGFTVHSSCPLTYFDLYNRSCPYVHCDISFNYNVEQLTFALIIVSSADASERRLKLVIRETGILLFVAKVLCVELCVSWIHVHACAIHV